MLELQKPEVDFHKYQYSRLHERNIETEELGISGGEGNEYAGE